MPWRAAAANSAARCCSAPASRCCQMRNPLAPTIAQATRTAAAAATTRGRGRRHRSLLGAVAVESRAGSPSPSGSSRVAFCAASAEGCWESPAVSGRPGEAVLASRRSSSARARGRGERGRRSPVRPRLFYADGVSKLSEEFIGVVAAHDVLRHGDTNRRRCLDSCVWAGN